MAESAPLHHVECGHGAPVVFVHGSASDHRTWAAQLQSFGARFRAIAYSRRHHWPNPAIAGARYAMPDHVDDLHALLRSLDAAPAHLVGSSYGAFVCLLLAIRAPRMVRTLVLAEPPVVPLLVGAPPRAARLLALCARRPRTAWAILRFQATGIRPAADAVRRGDIETAVRAFGCAVLGRADFERLSAARLEQARANFTGAELRSPGLPALRRDDLRRLRIPTLLVSGERSPRVFHRLGERLQALIPDSERVVVPDASHLMHEDNAAAFDGAVQAFLARNAPVHR